MEAKVKQIDISSVIFLFLGMFITVWANTSIKIMLPDIMTEYSVQINWLSWVNNAYSLPYAVLMPFAGKIGDVFGAKRFFLIGMLVLSIGAGLCVVDSAFWMVLAGRLMQGIGAAFVYTNGLILLLETTPEQRRGSVLGWWSSFIMAGAVAGPVFAGFLLEVISWHTVFLVVLFLALANFAGAIFKVKEKTHLSSSRSFDFSGAVTLISGISLLLLALTMGPDWGWFNPFVIAMDVSGILLLYIFYLVEKNVDSPMVSLHLFREKHFSAAMVAGFINNFTVIGTIFVMPIFLQLVRGFRPSEVALVLAPVAFAAAVVGPFGGWISDRLGFFPPIGFGMLLRGLSFLMLSWLSPVSGFIFMLITLFINGVGLGFTASPTLNAAVSVSENGEYGMTAGLYSMVQYIGGAVGVSITSVIVYSRVPSPEALKTMTTSVPGFSHSFVFLAGLCVAGFLVSLAMRTEKSYRTARRKTNAPNA